LAGLGHPKGHPVKSTASVSQRVRCARIRPPEEERTLVAFTSQWIIVDIDTSGGEAGQDEAWDLWTGLCLSWGLPEPLAPHVQSARGGWHVYFAVPPHIDPSTLRQPGAIKGRINVRCIGYTVAAGSYYDGAGGVLEIADNNRFLRPWHAEIGDQGRAPETECRQPRIRRH
jgi:hypothetical protein